MDKNIFKEQIKKLKKILSSFNNGKEVLDCINYSYEKISNRFDKNYDDLYNVKDIFSTDTYKYLAKRYKANETVILEIINFDKVPQGFLFLYNKFVGKMQIELEIFILKDKIA